MKTRILLFTFLFCLATVISAQIIHVPGDKSTIQAGIDAAINGDTVLVDQGVYHENIYFRGKAITLSSNYIITQDSVDIYNTIIDGSLPLNPDSASVVYFIDNEDTLSVIHGFTIQGGKGTRSSWTRAGGGIKIQNAGPIIEHNRIVNNECTDHGQWVSGGGIDIYHSNNYIPIIRDNEISNNACYKLSGDIGVTYGAGICASYGNECFIERNIIEDNLCSHEVVYRYALGGGIMVENITVYIVDNVITNNTVFSDASSYINWGGGIYGYEVKGGSTISGNTISNNIITAQWRNGGGIGIYNNLGKVSIDRNIIRNNEARRGAGFALETGQDVLIINNIFQENIAGISGGGIWVRDDYKSNNSIPYSNGSIHSDNNPDSFIDDGIPVIANNTFIENDASNNGLSIHTESSSTPLIAFNNIFYNQGNGSEIFISVIGSEVHLYNNLLDTNSITSYGTWYGVNNLYCDPGFDDNSCHLSDTSCCINEGTNKVHVDGMDYFPPDYDMEGEVRPQNMLFDIGADEKYVVIQGLGEINHNELICKIFPNPTNTYVHIQYTVYNIQYANLTLYDIHGRLVESLVNGIQTSGDYKIRWNADAYPAGVYIMKLTIGESSVTGKIIKH